MSTHVCLVINNDIVEERLRRHFEPQFTFDLFDGTHNDFSGFSAVLIVESYPIKGQYMSIVNIWRQYLSLHYPEIKLIVAGFNRHEGNSNFISLLDLHDEYNLEKKIADALPAEKDLALATIENGFDKVSAKLKLFFSGHNNESIIDAISKVRQVLNDVELSLHGSKSLGWEKRSFADIWQEQLWANRKAFQHFFSRWNYYKSYFDCLPFVHKLNAAQTSNFINALSGIFSSPKVDDDEKVAEMEARYRTLDPFNRIGEMAALYRKINNQYINPEVLGSILLIDDDVTFHQQMKSNFASFTVKSVYSEAETNTLSHNSDFDIILLDLDLGSERFAGLDMINGLKKKYPKTPLCIVTAHNSPDIIKYAIIEEGAEYFLSKSGFDSEKWAMLFINLALGKRYALGDILFFNEKENWEDSPNILVVEDEDDWYQKYKELSTAYHFVRANTVQQAKGCLKKQSFDLILLDLYLKIDGEPIMIGQELIPYVQQKFNDIPLIIISKDNSPRTQKVLLEMGIEKFLKKQKFESELWLQIIQTEIQQKRQKSKLASLYNHE